MKYLTTVNQLGNYITKRLEFHLREEADYNTTYVPDKWNKYKRVKKHTSTYFIKSHVSVEYVYQFREVRIIYYDTIDITITFDFTHTSFYQTEYINELIEHFTKIIPIF